MCVCVCKTCKRIHAYLRGARPNRDAFGPLANNITTKCFSLHQRVFVTFYCNTIHKQMCSNILTSVFAAYHHHHHHHHRHTLPQRRNCGLYNFGEIFTTCLFVSAARLTVPLLPRLVVVRAILLLNVFPGTDANSPLSLSLSLSLSLPGFLSLSFSLSRSFSLSLALRYFLLHFTCSLLCFSFSSLLAINNIML